MRVGGWTVFFFIEFGVPVFLNFGIYLLGRGVLMLTSPATIAFNLRIW